MRRNRRRRRVRSAAGHDVGVALHPPHDAADPRGCRHGADGRVSTSASRARQRRLLHHQRWPNTPVTSASVGCRRHPSRTRSTTTTRSSSRRTSACRTTGRCRRPIAGRGLHGNFEGFFRDDNGQSDPAISSLFDFPTNDPTYTRSACPSSVSAATSATWAPPAGRAAERRPHQVKVYGTYLLGSGLNWASASTGAPAAASPLTGRESRLRQRRRNSGHACAAPVSRPTTTGFKTRTPADVPMDLHADYNFRLFGARHLRCSPTCSTWQDGRAFATTTTSPRRRSGPRTRTSDVFSSIRIRRTFRFGVRVQFPDLIGAQRSGSGGERLRPRASRPDNESAIPRSSMCRVRSRPAASSTGRQDPAEPAPPRRRGVRRADASARCATHAAPAGETPAALRQACRP